MENLNYLLIFSAPFCLSLFFTPLVRLFVIKLGIIAFPRADRWHKRPTALMGGIAIYLAFLISFVFFGLVNKSFLSLLLGSTFLFVIGLVDDKIRITPYFKLFVQIIAACIPIFLGGLLTGMPINNIFIIPLIILWIVAVTNSFNLLDNIDGLACGISAITAFMLFVSLTISGEKNLGLISLILCGASLGFLPYNFNRAKIFMGDSGSMFLGYSLGVIAISGASGKHITNVLTTMLIPVLILGVPIFDTLFVMVARRLKGKSVFEGGKDHTSHRLVMLGISQKKTVLLLYAISIIFGIIALFYAKTNLLIISIIAFCSFVVLVYFGFFLFEVTSENGQKMHAKETDNWANKTVLNNIFMYKRKIIEVFLDFTSICIAYYAAYFLRFEGGLFSANSNFLKDSLPWIIVIKLMVFFSFGLYRGVWRYIGISDFFTIFKVVTLSSISSILFLTFVFRFQGYSRAVFFIDWMLLLFLILGSRFLFRIVGEFLLNLRKGIKNILIFGAGDTGEMVIREIKKNKFMHYNVLGFIDDNPKKIGSRIHGVSVLGDRSKMKQLVGELKVKEVLIAAPTLGNTGEIDIINICQACGVEYRTIKGILD